MLPQLDDSVCQLEALLEGGAKPNTSILNKNIKPNNVVPNKLELNPITKLDKLEPLKDDHKLNKLAPLKKDVAFDDANINLIKKEQEKNIKKDNLNLKNDKVFNKDKIIEDKSPNPSGKQSLTHSNKDSEVLNQQKAEKKSSGKKSD